MLSKALSETTAHGLSRVASGRATLLRIMWLIIFIIFLALYTRDMVIMVQKYLRFEVSTTTFANAVPFEMPDIYICPNKIVAQSRSANLNLNEYKFLQDHMNEIIKTVEQLDGGSPKAGGKLNVKKFAQYLAASMNYRNLSDILGHQIDQFVLDSKIMAWNNKEYGDAAEIIPTIFYHHTYLNCIKLTMTEEQKRLMLNPNTYFLVLLQLDVEYDQFPQGPNVLALKGTGKYNEEYNIIDLSLSNNNQRFFISPSVKVYLVSKNNYPDEYSTKLVLGPGQDHKISINQQVTEMGTGLTDTCQANPSIQYYKNPYNESEPYVTEATVNYCCNLYMTDWYLKNINASITPMPLVLKYSNLRTQGDVTNLTKEEYNFIENSYKENKFKAIQLKEKCLEQCMTQKKCIKTEYSTQGYSVNWPDFSSLTRVIADTILRKRDKPTYQEKPTWEFISKLYSVVMNTQVNKTLVFNASVEKHQSVLHDYASKSLIRITFQGSNSHFSKIVQSVPYTFADLVASLGGLLGLYLGCSLLTLCELLEIFYNFIEIIKNKKTVDIMKKDNKDINDEKVKSSSTNIA